ncbi:protein translocase subunit SecDF [Bacillus songklensis]|uniref:Multifunctional fusion protein n=1 Tax=Bacillus songklensis TaxID=1069116 RepID=A0ABV8AZJ4_9BACI
MVKRGRIVAFFLLVLLIFSTMGATVSDIANRIKLGLDLQGGFEILYEVKPAKEGDVINEKVLHSTVQALEKRINVLGVSEPIIQIEGKNRIRVQLAGVKDQNKAREILSTEAQLSFRDVNDKLLMDGTDLAQGGAKQSFDQNGKPNVALKLKSAEKFKNVTQQVLNMGAPNNLLVIWLDYEQGKDSFQKESAKQEPKYLSAASVNQVFNTNEVTITGNFTVKEAQELANLLNAGALPVQLDEMYSTSVGAQFGDKALDKMITAGFIGVGLVFLFMIFYYRLPGIIAVITLSIYIYLILLIFDWMNGVLTLPGIAALLLGVGMAVDANIITYERIRDELKSGKSVVSAYRSGNRRSLSTIFDANLTTILAAGVLFVYGTSSVKGFATMLIVSILASFVTAVYGTRLFLGLWVNSRALNKRPSFFRVKPSEIQDLSKDAGNKEIPTKFDRIDFVKYSKVFFTFSIVVTILGILSLAIFKLNLGIDFASGTRVEIPANEAISAQEVKQELKQLHLEPKDVVIAGNNNDTGIARFIGVLSKDEIGELKTHFKEKYGNEPNVSTVSPTVGRELARNALIAVLIASVGIIIYVSVRFELYMALAAVIALLHDAFFMISFFSFSRLEVDLTFIAAVLTIIGYSINDTIVTFDRMREHMKTDKVKTREDLVYIVNRSLRETFTRSVNTVLTVIFTVIALIFFGSEAILNFSIALLVGLLLGVYSSLFIAAQLWLVWKAKSLGKPRKVVEEETLEP